MLEAILNSFEREIRSKFEALNEELEEGLDFTEVEKSLSETMDAFSASLLELMLTQLFQDAQFLASLKEMGGRCGMHFERYREITIRLYNGQAIKILSPYFVKARPKKGRKKKKKKQGPKGGGHLGLAVLGFVGLCSGNLVSEVVKLALLCPSFKVAKAVLSERGIAMDVKTIRRLCRDLGLIGLEFRGDISLSGTEDLDGHTLVIGIDGGRLRERRTKRGRKKKGQKRQGYHTDWKEPKLFILYLLDAKGDVVKEFSPLQDATMGDHYDMFALLQRYLDALDLSRVNRVVFCGDGAPWIWSGVEDLCIKLGMDFSRITQVIDYTHAKQNLQEIIDLTPKRLKNREKVAKEWKTLLWKGDLQGLYQSIGQVLSGKRKKQALNKWENYFHKNQKRMQYQAFEADHIPCGSGSVESAIRRVINMRLKSAGIFWKHERAEYFLFLRSQLLSGRWQTFMSNVTRRWVESIENEEKNNRHQQLPKAA